MATSHSFTQLWARNIDSRVGRDGAIPNLSFPYFRLYFLLRSSHSLYLLLCVYRRNLTHVSCPGSREPREPRDPVVNPRTLRGTPLCCLRFSCRWRPRPPCSTPRTRRSSTSGTCTCSAPLASVAASCTPGCSTSARTRRSPNSAATGTENLSISVKIVGENVDLANLKFLS